MSDRMTPGPWAVEQAEEAETEVPELHDGPVHHYLVVDEQDVTVAKCFQQPGDAWTAEANAKVIAAAPHMLRLLNEAYVAIPTDTVEDKQLRDEVEEFLREQGVIG